MDPNALMRNIHYTMRVCPTWEYEGQPIDVEVLSVSSLLRRLSWSRINLLKINIEVCEGDLLKLNVRRPLACKYRSTTLDRN